MIVINDKKMDIKFKGGFNIAIKIPKSKYENTVDFYKNILKLEVTEVLMNNSTVSKSHKVDFGDSTIWLDCVDNYTHSEVWLELRTNDVEKATEYLLSNSVETCDEIEEIPQNMHWIQDPSGTVFILKQGIEQ